MASSIDRHRPALVDPAGDHEAGRQLPRPLDPEPLRLLAPVIHPPGGKPGKPGVSSAENPVSVQGKPGVSSGEGRKPGVSSQKKKTRCQFTENPVSKTRGENPVSVHRRKPGVSSQKTRCQFTEKTRRKPGVSSQGKTRCQFTRGLGKPGGETRCQRGGKPGVSSQGGLGSDLVFGFFVDSIEPKTA